MELLRIVNLKTYFEQADKVIRAVDGVSFTLNRGEVLGIIGESGAGKSVTALSVLGLARLAGACFTDGQVWFKEKDLFGTPSLYRGVRGRRIALIPQEAGQALNPVSAVGRQLEEVLSVHLGVPFKQARKKTVEFLEEAGLPDAEMVAGLYPHQLSGGMLQRVLTALALSCRPDIVIADEPASALDACIQDQVLTLLLKTREETGLAVILISHDLRVIARCCDTVLVMSRGRVMEHGPAVRVLAEPSHPYTQSMIESYRRLEYLP